MNHIAFGRTKLFLLLIAFTFPFGLSAQMVGVGTNNPQERLHVNGNIRSNPLAGTGNRMVMSDANGTLINMAAGTNGQVLTQTATGPAWQNAAGSATAWEITGNAGTSIATNFLGTTDNVSFALRTNNNERFRVFNTGQTVFNLTTTLATDVLAAYSGGTDYAINGYATGTGVGVYGQDVGGGIAVAGFTNHANGTAGFFETNNAGNSFATVEIQNTSGTGEALLIDQNGAGRGIEIDMPAGNAELGLGSFHAGTGRAGNFQNSGTTTTEPTVFASSTGNAARTLNAQNSSTGATQMVGFFAQSSTGTNTATYNTAAGVWAQSTGIRGGVSLASGASANTIGLNAQYIGGGNIDAVAVLALANSNNGGTFDYGYGLVGEAAYVGVIGQHPAGGGGGLGSAAVVAIGNLTATGTKAFQIDHPLDPANKVLKHFSIESDEVLNVYRGSVTFNQQGEAEVTMANWFHSINSNSITYHLTPIGAPADLYIKSEIQNGKFTIAGGRAGMKASWMVYAERNDPYLQKNPSQRTVEFDKKPNQKGKYFMPELFNQPSNMRILNPQPEQMQKTLPTGKVVQRGNRPHVQLNRGHVSQQVRPMEPISQNK